MRIELNRILQRSLNKYFWKQGQRVLIAVQTPVIDLAGEIDPESLKLRVPSVMKSDQMREYVSDIWVKGGSLFAIDTIGRIHRRAKKDDEVDYWEDYFRRYIRERSVLKLNEIMDTQTRIINNLIDEVLEEGFQNGLGLDKIQRAMRGKLIEGLTEINRYQAERIARTEIMGASNTGSFEGAKETGVMIGKEWMTSGLPNIRPSHLEYEALGTVDMDYEYNTGLQYPGDPNGDPDEICNCRCIPTYSTED